MFFVCGSDIRTTHFLLYGWQTGKDDSMKKVLSMIVMLVMLVFVIPCNAEDVQQNVPSDWATDYIVKAESIGLLQNVSGLVYKENITREKFCELIYDFIMITQRGITTPEHTNQFTDTDNDKIATLNAAEIIYGKSSAEWASSSVQVMSNLGFMNGVGENKFAPKDNYTAEQSITTLVRIYEATRKTYEYITPLGTVTSETDYNGHINFGIEASVRIVFTKDKVSQTRFLLPGPFKAFTDQMSSMYITFDDFAKIFNGKWELNNNAFNFNYDASQNIVLSEYTPNETTTEEWPNKTGSTPVVSFSGIATILVNGEEKEIKESTGGRVYNSGLMMYNNELYIPVQMVAELLDCDIAVTDILWN